MGSLVQLNSAVAAEAKFRDTQLQSDGLQVDCPLKRKHWSEKQIYTWPAMNSTKHIEICM